MRAFPGIFAELKNEAKNKTSLRMMPIQNRKKGRGKKQVHMCMPMTLFEPLDPAMPEANILLNFSFGQAKKISFLLQLA